MTLEEALIIHDTTIFPYFTWNVVDDAACVDGWCSIEQLEAMIVIMKETIEFD